MSILSDGDGKTHLEKWWAEVELCGSFAKDGKKDEACEKFQALNNDIRWTLRSNPALVQHVNFLVPFHELLWFVFHWNSDSTRDDMSWIWKFPHHLITD